MTKLITTNVTTIRSAHIYTGVTGTYGLKEIEKEENNG